MRKILLTTLLLSMIHFAVQADDYQQKQNQAVANIPLDLQEVKKIGYVVVEPGISDNFRLVLLGGGEDAGYSQVYIQWLRMQEGWEAPQMIQSVPIKEINKDYNYFVTDYTCLNEACSKLRFETILGEYLHANNPKKTIFTLQLKPNGKYSIERDGNKTNISSKSKHIELQLFCLKDVTHKGKCGYFNEDAEFSIEPRFDADHEIEEFDKNGLAAVGQDGKWGFINTKGEWVIQPQFDKAENFMEGVLARAKLNGKWGFINREGEWVIRPQFIHYTISKESGSTYYNYRSDNFFENGIVGLKKNGKWGYLNTLGEWIIPPQFDEGQRFAKNGLAAARMGDKKTGKWGFINTKGEWVIKPQFDDAFWQFNKGLAPVVKNGKYGYVDTKGQWVIEPQFDYTMGFEDNGLAEVELNGLHGFINVEGEWVIKPKYYDVWPFRENGLAVVRSDKGVGFINMQGNWVIQPKRQVRGFSYNVGLAQAQAENGKWGFVNVKDEWVIPPKFDGVKGFKANSLAMAKKGNKLGFINTQGDFVAEIKTVCDVNIVVRPNGEHIYPKNSVEDICTQSKYYK